MDALNMFILAVLFSLFISFLVFLKNLLLGRMRTLAPKDEGKDDPDRSRFESSPSPPDRFLAALSDKRCPIHDKPYEGIAKIEVIEPEQALNIFHLSPTTVGELQIALCSDCIPLACSIRSSGFTWKRQNYKDHPEWPSSHLYPHLMGRKIAKLWSVQRRSPEHSKWTECVNPEVEKHAAASSLTSPTSPDEIVEKYAPYLKADNIYVTDDIPNKKLQKARENYAPIGSERPLLLVYDWADRGLLLTNKYVYVGGSVEPKRTMYLLRDITSVEKGAILGWEDVSDCIVVNGKRVCSFPVGQVADYFIFLLRELAEFSRTA